MTKLVIVESPSKAKKIKEILGAGYNVSASVGHVRDLPDKEIGVDLETFTPTYELTSRGGDVIKKLKDMVATADHIYLATDPDREGEAIAWHLKAALSLKNNFSRIAFNEVTPAAIRKSIENPRALDMSLVAAQEARRVLDRLVGWQASPILWDSVGSGTSAGRVQSPAVRLVVERERAIRNFKPLSHFSARLNFAGAWFADLDNKKSGLGEEPDFYLIDRKLADELASIKSVSVFNFADSEKLESPSAPFTTSTLQQAASIVLKLDPGAAMLAAQKLFEGGHITYHRTDLPNLSDEGYGLACETARGLGWPVADKRKRWTSKEGAQEAHEAIRPTHFDKAESGESDAERALYKMIYNHTLASVLTDARYAVRIAELSATRAGGERVIFTARGRTLVDAGWRKVYEAPADDEDSSDPAASNPIPALNVGDRLDVESGRVVEKTTKAPARYTQASLIKKLESSGIGRPSTYAAIMQKIVERQYIEQNGKRQLSATPLGEQIIDVLADHVGFCDYDYTAAIESDLDKIANNKTPARPVLAAAQARLLSELGKIKSLAPVYPCPSCGKNMGRRHAKSGDYFWGCSSYPDCKTTLPDAGGKPGERVERSPDATKILFVVPFDDKDKAKKLGLRWDSDSKSWYAPDAKIAAAAKKKWTLK